MYKRRRRRCDASYNRLRALIRASSGVSLTLLISINRFVNVEITGRSLLFICAQASERRVEAFDDLVNVAS